MPPAPPYALSRRRVYPIRTRLTSLQQIPPTCRNTAKVNKKLTSLLFGNEGGDAMDDTGMTEADKIGLVEDVLAIWGEDAAREIANYYGVNLELLGQEAASDT